MQGFNMGRYVPPDQEGLTTGNKLSGKHPLGSRARNLHKTGDLTVRFEMPFAVWCSTCQPADSVLIGQGVRFNAHKKKVGTYHSTPIYSFRMKHSVCGGWIEIRTDPQNTAYVVTEGGRRRDTGTEGDYVDENGVAEISVRHIVVGHKDVTAAAASAIPEDPFAKLEGKVADKSAFVTAQTRVEALMKRQERDWDDPYEQSRKLRKVFRAERKRLEVVEGATEALRDRMSLGIELLDENEADRARAGIVDFKPANGLISSSSVAKVNSRPLFEKKKAVPQSLPSSSSKDHVKKKKKGKSLKAADLAAARKDMLRQELSGNTRAAIDPFLNDEKVWQPGFSKIRKANQPRLDKIRKDDNSEDVSAGISKTTIEGNPPGTEGVDDPGVSNALQAGNGATPVLVDYGSSDTD